MPAKAAQAPDAQASQEPAAATGPPKKGDHVFLVDGSSYIFRAYHALPPLTRKSDGLQLNAVYGFCNMLWKLLRDMKPEERPTHLAVVFDKSERTFRTEFYPEYKAHRSEPPDDLRPQFPLIREAVRAFDMPCLEQAGFEADDLIATYVRQACDAGANATIVASDKDLMQLVNDCVVMYDTMKDKRIGIPEVIEKFGVPPEKVIEVQALIGDSTDNVPGVPGIGVKTAAQLIGEYGDLETLLARAGEIKQEKRRQTLIENAEKARLSKRLVTLDDHVAARCAARRPGGARARLQAARGVPQGDGVRLAHPPGGGVLRRRGGGDRGGGEIRGRGLRRVTDPHLRRRPAIRNLVQVLDEHASPRQGALALTGGADPPSKARGAAPPTEEFTPPVLAATRLNAARNAKVDRSRYEIVRSLDRLNAWIARARDLGRIAIDTQTTSLDPMQATLCGFSLALAPNEACYVPLSHRQGGEGGNGSLFAGDIAPDQISERAALDALKPLLEDKRRAQDRPELQVRLADLCAARDRDRALRRHHADVLRGRCRALGSWPRARCRNAISITRPSTPTSSPARENPG